MDHNYEQLKKELENETTGDYDFVTNIGPYWEDLQPRPKAVKAEIKQPKKTWLQLFIAKVKEYCI